VPNTGLAAGGVHQRYAKLRSFEADGIRQMGEELNVGRIAKALESKIPASP